MCIPKLHQLTRVEVVSLLGEIYEHSAWVAEALLDQGLTEADSNSCHLASRMQSIVDAANINAKLALLRAHPELVGKLALAGELTRNSVAEQANAGLDQCSVAEIAEFHELNSDYKTRFGHPFIIAVWGLNRADILSAFRSRLENNRETEFAIALAEVHKIASLRLQQLFALPSS